MLNEGVSSRPVRKIVLMGCAPDADLAASFACTGADHQSSTHICTV